MIQQLISTSAPKCLNGNAGFGIVAQTHGMAPNVANAVNALSAYSHHFPAGNPQNPAAFLHTLRRTGGMLRHIVSRVADCGNDYTGRTNRLAHHWLVEENDVWTLPCGPAALAAQAIFRTEWNEASRELPPKDLENVPVSVRKCTEWEQLTGDAGWAGIVAERAEKGDPISIIFKIGMNPLSLLAEVFALLPPEVRWQTSFSTFFIKSQEPAGASREDKIQIKCFLEGTEEANFARQSPNTLVIDLRQKLPTGQQLFAAGACSAPGKYVEAARTGRVQTVSPGLAQAPQVRTKFPAEHDAPFVTPIPSVPEQDVFAIDDLSMNVPKLSRGLNAADKAQQKRQKPQSPWLMLSVCAVVVLLGLGILTWLLVSAKSAKEIADAKMAEQQNQEAAVKEQSAKEAEEKENARTAVETAKNELRAIKDQAKNEGIKLPEQKEIDEKLAENPETTEELNKLAKDIQTLNGNAKKEISTEIENRNVNQIAGEIEKLIETQKRKYSELTNNKGTIKEKDEQIQTDIKLTKNVLQQKKLDELETIKKRITVNNSLLETAISEAKKKANEEQTKTNAVAENEKIKQQLADLPDFWEDRGLPLSGGFVQTSLGKSSFLWEIRKSVKLSVIPFIDLSKMEKFEKPIQIDDKEPHRIVFWYEAGKDVNDNPIHKTVVIIELKGDGLNFKWDPAFTEKGITADYDSNDFRRELNRILLSKLKIEIPNIGTKKIALINPAKCNNKVYNGAKYFTLWKQEGKEFVIYNTENVPLLLDFTEWFNGDEKNTIPESKIFQKSPGSLAYAPQTGTDLSCGITLMDEKDLKFHIGFVSKSLKPLLEEKENIKKEITQAQKNKPKIGKRTLETTKQRLENELGQLPDNQQNKERRDNLDKEIKKYEGELNDISRIENEIRKFNEQLQQKEQEIKDEKKKWANVRIEAFSIYLLKHDIKPEEIGKPENRLLLLEVKP